MLFLFGFVIVFNMSVEEKKIETPIYGALEEAIDHMKKAYEIMNQQAVDLHKEKETFESVAKNLNMSTSRLQSS